MYTILDLIRFDFQQKQMKLFLDSNKSKKRECCELLE
jgi:hypothetical protein